MFTVEELPQFAFLDSIKFFSDIKSWLNFSVSIKVMTSSVAQGGCGN